MKNCCILHGRVFVMQKKDHFKRMIALLDLKLFWLLQVTDYAIARRIVDLHSRNEESVDRIYSVEDITRYIMFARQFKPKVW